MNGVANVNVQNGKVISFGESFFKGTVPSLTRRDTIPPDEAVEGLAKALKIPMPEAPLSVETENNQVVVKGATFVKGDIPATERYVQTSDGKLQHVWSLEAQMKSTDNWYHAQISTSGGLY